MIIQVFSAQDPTVLDVVGHMTFPYVFRTATIAYRNDLVPKIHSLIGTLTTKDQMGDQTKDKMHEQTNRHGAITS